MKAKFGLTNAQYTTLYNKLTRCWICGAEKSIVAGRPSRLVIDHDHTKTGPESIRGVLCHYCNMAIGLAEDNPDMLRRMAEYIDLYIANGGPLTGVKASGILITSNQMKENNDGMAEGR